MMAYVLRAEMESDTSLFYKIPELFLHREYLVLISASFQSFLWTVFMLVQKVFTLPKIKGLNENFKQTPTLWMGTG